MNPAAVFIPGGPMPEFVSMVRRHPSPDERIALKLAWAAAWLDLPAKCVGVGFYGLPENHLRPNSLRAYNVRTPSVAEIVRAAGSQLGTLPREEVIDAAVAWGSKWYRHRQAAPSAGFAKYAMYALLGLFRERSMRELGPDADR